MSQITSFGKKAEVLLVEGAHTSQKGMDIGQYWENGIKRYRWSHIRAGSMRGMLHGHRATVSGLLVSGICFVSAKPAGFGAVGDHEIYIWGLSNLSAGNASADAYIDGTLEIVSNNPNSQGVGVFQIRGYTLNPEGAALFRLKEQINIDLSTWTHAKLRKNDYADLYACSRVTRISNSQFIPRGFTTASTTTSSFQWLQTAGPGVARLKGDVAAAGTYVGAVTSAGLSSILQVSGEVTNMSVLLPVAITRTGGTALNWCSVDILLESL